MPALFSKTFLTRITPPLLLCQRRQFSMTSGLAAVGRWQDTLRRLTAEDISPKEDNPLAGRQHLSGSQAEEFPKFLKKPTIDFPYALRVDDTDSFSLSKWARICCELVNERLLQYGAVLVRGLPIKTVDDFSSFVKSLEYQPLAYRGGDGYRQLLDKEASVYHSTDEDPLFTIGPHNEMSYTDNPPAKVLFCCIEEPIDGSGGLTPIAKSSEIMSRVDSVILDRLEEKGVRYSTAAPDKNVYPHYNTWQQVFLTENKKEVEKQIEAHGWDYSWDDNNRITYHKVKPAFKSHPVTGEKCWFNQINNGHISQYEANPKFPGRESLQLSFYKDTAYGDGSDVEPDVIQHINTCMWQSAVGFLWKKGDVLFIDNFSTLHAKLGFTGNRKIVTTLTAD